MGYKFSPSSQNSTTVSYGLLTLGMPTLNLLPRKRHSLLLELNLKKEKDMLSLYPKPDMDCAVAVYAGHNDWQMHCVTWDLFH